MRELSLETLLASRRQNVLERERERCPIGKALHTFYIASIDQELQRRWQNERRASGIPNWTLP